MPVPFEVISVLLPFLISVPLYILGRRLWFKNYAQSQMHTIRSGRLFTLAICLIHMILTVVLYVLLFF